LLQPNHDWAIPASSSDPSSKDRGLLKPGYFADVLGFDPKVFNELANYQEPRVLATGVRYLAVNGQLAIDNGSLTATLAGRALKH
jgi:N-acyl-D-aspartate/D-glutamate deacylase